MARKEKRVSPIQPPPRMGLLLLTRHCRGDAYRFVRACHLWLITAKKRDFPDSIHVRPRAGIDFLSLKFLCRGISHKNVACSTPSKDTKRQGKIVPSVDIFSTLFSASRFARGLNSACMSVRLPIRATALSCCPALIADGKTSPSVESMISSTDRPSRDQARPRLDIQFELLSVQECSMYVWPRQRRSPQHAMVNCTHDHQNGFMSWRYPCLEPSALSRQK